MGYFLVARDMTSNDFQIVELKSKWYLKNGTDVLKRSNPLEVIDLVTTRFSSREAMAKRLVDGNYIPHNNYDFYIVSKYKNNGVEKLKYQEVLYNVKEDRTKYFREIAYNSLKGNIKCEQNIRLYDKFIVKNYYSPLFSRIVNDNLTALPNKFVTAFKNVRNYETVPYKLKYQNDWCLHNYSISRSIVDAFNRFDNLNNNDTYLNHVMYFKNLSNERLKIHKKLLEVCDKNYVAGQLNIFDLPEKEEVKEELTIQEKKRYAIDYLKNIGLSTFTINDGKKMIDLDNYLEYMTTDEYKILNKGLNTRVVKAAYLYNLHSDKIKTAGTTPGNFAVLQEDLNADLYDLKKSLNDDKIVEKTYNFCKTLDNVRKKSLSEGVNAYQKNRDKK